MVTLREKDVHSDKRPPPWHMPSKAGFRTCGKDPSGILYQRLKVPLHLTHDAFGAVLVNNAFTINTGE